MSSEKQIPQVRYDEHDGASIHGVLDDARRVQSNILIEDQIRNDFRMMEVAAERSAPKNRIERIGWFVVGSANAIAALALASMAWEDRFYPGLLICAFFLLFASRFFARPSVNLKSCQRNERHGISRASHATNTVTN